MTQLVVECVNKQELAVIKCRWTCPRQRLATCLFRRSCSALTHHSGSAQHVSAHPAGARHRREGGGVLWVMLLRKLPGNTPGYVVSAFGWGWIWWSGGARELWDLNPLRRAVWGLGLRRPLHCKTRSHGSARPQDTPQHSNPSSAFPAFRLGGRLGSCLGRLTLLRGLGTDLGGEGFGFRRASFCKTFCGREFKFCSLGCSDPSTTKPKIDSETLKPQRRHQSLLCTSSSSSGSLSFVRSCGTKCHSTEQADSGFVVGILTSRVWAIDGYCWFSDAMHARVSSINR